MAGRSAAASVNNGNEYGAAVLPLTCRLFDLTAAHDAESEDIIPPPLPPLRLLLLLLLIIVVVGLLGMGDVRGVDSPWSRASW